MVAGPACGTIQPFQKYKAKREELLKVLVVTGASRGIGAAVALLGARRGYFVVANYNTSGERAEQLIADIRDAGGKAIAVRADVSTEEGARSLFETVDRDTGAVDALVNNAGTILPRSRVTDVSAADLERLWRINVTSQFLCAREAVKRMSTAHGGKGGSIVNMSSVHARIGAPGQFVSYAATKGAIDSFTHGLALEVVGEGIRVNAVRPGLIDTELHAIGGEPDRAKAVGATVPIGRAGTPDEVAQTVLWLLSDDASYVVNTLVDVGGGR
jgi:NAD(P)-dependent dehydrogenase (short-subunit alcohol dehydrogenase family)